MPIFLRLPKAACQTCNIKAELGASTAGLRLADQHPNLMRRGKQSAASTFGGQYRLASIVTAEAQLGATSLPAFPYPGISVYGLSGAPSNFAVVWIYRRPEKFGRAII